MGDLVEFPGRVGYCNSCGSQVRVVSHAAWPVACPACGVSPWVWQSVAPSVFSNPGGFRITITGLTNLPEGA